MLFQYTSIRAKITSPDFKKLKSGEVIFAQSPSLKRQQGVVIVVALFIVALVATMAYVMMARLERDTRRTSLIVRDTQAEFYAQGSIAWAMDQLRNDWETQKSDQLIDAVPIRSPVNEVNGYKVVSTIYDVQGRFNLNNLTNLGAQVDFKRLLQTIDPNLSETKAIEIAFAVFDWISPGSQHDLTTQHDLTKYYLELPVPYRPAHRPMLSVSELRLVKGMTPSLFNALQPYVTALPASTQVNIQSAPAPVLVTLSPTMTLEAAKAVEQLRAETPFVSRERFLNLDVVKNHPVKPEKVTVTSSYFLVETNVVIEKQNVTLYTLLQRSAAVEKERFSLSDVTDSENLSFSAAGTSKVVVRVLWQSKGVG